ncbi:MAG TPA: toxin-antitoxin system HicB family antitoxin [Methylomirabilota bacterium]|nr:toxin-antitoxin system HicB family antitoxin [Methylomirabilota bacterium]
MSAIRIELPEQVHQRALELARQQSMPLDRLMVVALVEKLSAMFPDEALEERAKRGTQEDFEEFMKSVPDVEPDDYDKLPKG